MGVAKASQRRRMGVVRRSEGIPEEKAGLVGRGEGIPEEKSGCGWAW